MGDRFFDLGNLAVNQELGPAQVESFLLAYFAIPTVLASCSRDVPLHL